MGEIVIRLRCVNLPGRVCCGRSAVRLGIQRGREVVDDVDAGAGEAVFEAPLRAVLNDTTGAPNFLGPYAQGTPQARFIYLDWGERRAGSWDGFRRAKVHLSHLTWEDVGRHLASGEPIEAVVDMTDRFGGPLCASVKPTHIRWAESR